MNLNELLSSLVVIASLMLDLLSIALVLVEFSVVKLLIKFDI